MNPIQIKLRKSRNRWFVTVTIDYIIVFSSMRDNKAAADLAAYRWLDSIKERKIICV